MAARLNNRHGDRTRRQTPMNTAVGPGHQSAEHPDIGIHPWMPPRTGHLRITVAHPRTPCRAAPEVAIPHGRPGSMSLSVIGPLLTETRSPAAGSAYRAGNACGSPGAWPVTLGHVSPRVGSQVAITTPLADVMLLLSRSDNCTPWGNSRRPVPSTSGWIISKYSSIRSAAISEPISTPLPVIARTPPDRALSAPTASQISPRSSVVLGHGRGSSAVARHDVLRRVVQRVPEWAAPGVPGAQQALVHPPPEQPSGQAAPAPAFTAGIG